MAVTQQDLDNLRTAIATGVRSTTIDGQTVTYATTDALIAAHNFLALQLANQTPLTPAPPRQAYGFYTGRGNH